MVIGTALQTFGDRLETEQEVLSFAADVLIDTYAAESAVARASQAMAAGHPHAPLHEAAARVFVSEAATRVEPPPGARSRPRWRATRCGRCSPRSAACSSRRH